MKKKILLAVTLGGLVPMGINAICFRYVDGPKGLDAIKVEVNATKIGSNLPTVGSTLLNRGETRWYTWDDVMIGGKTIYVTIKEHKGTFSLSPTLIRGKALNRGAAYDISIDNNKNITFTKVADSCKGLKDMKTFAYEKLAEALSKGKDK